MKKHKLISSLLAAAVSATLFAGCAAPEASMKLSPYGYVKYAAAKTVMTIAQNDPTGVYAPAAAALKKGTVRVKSTLGGINTSAGLYSDAAKKQYQLDYTLSSGKKSATGGVAADKTALYLYGDSENCSASYIIPYKDIAEKAKASIFSPDSKSEYRMTESSYSEFVTAIEQLDGFMNDKADDSKLIGEIIEDNIREVKADTRTSTVNFDGVKVKTNIVSYSLNGREIAAFISGISSDILASDKIGDETAAQLAKLDLSDLCSELMETDIDFDLRFYINSKTDTLMQIYCVFNVNEDSGTESLTASLFMGTDASDYKGMNGFVKMSSGEYSERISFDDKVTKNDKSAYEEKLTVKITSSGESLSLVTELKLDKASGKYSALMYVPEDTSGNDNTVTLNGTIKADAKTAEIYFDKLSAVDESFKLDTTVSFSQTGSFTKKKGAELMLVKENALSKKLDAYEGDIEAIILSSNGEIKDYYAESLASSAKYTTKTVFTAATVVATKMSIEGVKLNTSELSNSKSGSCKFKINGYSFDMSEYLGKDFEGYFYISLDKKTYAVEYAVWSSEPIPEKYRRQLSQSECTEYMKKYGCQIGCYPSL